MGLRVFILFIILTGCNLSTSKSLDAILSPDNKEKLSGYIIYYFDPSRDCLSCLKGIEFFAALQKAYPEIGFMVILRGKGTDYDNFQDELDASGITCETAWDKEEKFRKQFHIEKGPYLLMLNDEGKAIMVRKAHYSLPISKRFFLEWIEHL